MEGFALHILKLNIIAAGIILLVKLMSVFLKDKFTAQWKYLVWLILCLSLLIPVRLPAELSLFHLQVNDTDQNSLQSRSSQNIPSVSPNSGTSFLDKNNHPNSAPAASVSENPESKDSVSEYPTAETAKKSGFRIEITRQHLPIPLHLVSVIFVVLWIAVAVLKLICEAAAYHISIKNLKRMSLPVYNPVTVRAYSSVCRLRGVHNPPKLMQNAGLSTPLLTGLLKTELYLPAVGYTAEELKLIFHHELSHYRHKDLWYKMLLRICATVYWFNPFLQIMLKEAENDIENLCDTNVIRHCTANDHKLYRRLLLRTVAIQNHIPYVTASLNDSTMVFKDRILYMINLKHLKNNVLPGILLSVLLIITNVSFVLSASVNEPASSGNSQDTVSTSESDSLPDTSSSVTGKETDIPDDHQIKKQPETVQMKITEYEMYTTSSVNIRSLPSMDGTIINNIPAGSTVIVTGASQDGWLPVKINGVSGFISKDYLTTSLEEAQAAAAENTYTMDSDAPGTTENPADTTSDTASQTNDDASGSNDYNSNDTSYDNQNNEQDYEPDAPYNDDSPSAGGTSDTSDPFDLYSWDPGTDSYIPYQQAESDGSSIGQGSGWYYYDTASGSYQPW